MKRTMITSFLTVTALLAVTACSGDDDEGQSAGSSGQTQSPTLENILNNGELRVGIAETIPNAWQDANGEWQGYNVSVARNLAEELNVELELVEASQNAWIPQLQSGEFDVHMLGWFMTPERGIEVGFTEPVYVKGYTYVVREDSSVQSIEELNSPEYTVTGLLGGSEEAVAETYTPEATANFLSTSNPLDGANALRAERADAWIYPSDVIGGFLDNNDWARALNDEPVWNNPLAYTIRKGDSEWKFFLDAYITKIQESGDLDRWIDEAGEASFTALDSE